MASKTSKIFVWIILALVIVGLVGFGSQNFGGSVRSIGTIGDTEIEANRYFQELNSSLNAFRAQTGQQLPIAQAEAFGLTAQALQRVIDSTTLDNEAARIGLSVGDDTLRRQVMRMQEFQAADGKFNSETYEFVLQQSNLTPAEFEENLRADMTRAVLQTAITRAASTAPVFADTLYAFAREKRDFTWAKLDLSALEATPPAPTDADLQTYYEENPADYTLPEIKKVTVAWLRPEALLDAVDVDEADIRALYDSRAAQYNQPERRLVERLVFASEDEARAAMDAITSGEKDFPALVAERGLTLSDVDLGDVTKSGLGDAGDAIFALTEPGIVGPVPSLLGPAIFRMNAVLAAQSTPFEDVKDELRAEFAGDMARRAVADRITELEDDMAGGATLEDLTQNRGEIDLIKFDWQAGMDDGIAAYDEFQTAIAETGEGDFPEIITLDDGGLFALRVDQIDPPRLQDLDEVKDAVTAAWTHDKRLELLAEQARGLLPILQQGDESLSSLGLTEIAETGQTRDAVIDGTPPEMVVDVFSMQENDWAVLEDVDGVVLVHLDRIFPADQTGEEAVAAKAAFTQQINQEIGLDYQSAFTRALQADAGITLDQAVITAIHRQFP
ncbi:MAG TPA: peptidylprolyl isomerase [Aliiroseovarius sp.]|nr:peptidylprolyl isomerase [Aliiroseovarius sp.]